MKKEEDEKERDLVKVRAWYSLGPYEVDIEIDLETLLLARGVGGEQGDEARELLRQKIAEASSHAIDSLDEVGVEEDESGPISLE